MGSHRPADLLRATGRGMRGRASTRLGRAPTMMPLVGRPGEPVALTLPGAWEDYHSIAGPTWRNEIAADVTLELGSRKAAKAAADVRCPTLVQISDFDSSAPPHATAKAAFKAGPEVRPYPGDHFDLFPGHPWPDAAVRPPCPFLSRHLPPEPNPDRKPILS